ncbi:MAG: hypothetical protein K2W82_15005 [Candidatus Obscuribacterales bacterium]|nr:hypothetical protein [Candidatus Obscuribacterales bacterium]
MSAMEECKPRNSQFDWSDAFLALPKIGMEQIQAKEELANKLDSCNQLVSSDFERVIRLGQSLIEGDLRKIEEAVLAYATKPSLLIEHIRFLAFAFAGSGVVFLDPAVLKVEIATGQFRDAAVISIYLKQAMRVLTVPTVAYLGSSVYAVSSNLDGCSVMEPAPSEEPRLLAKQIGGVLCAGSLPGPPPLSA